MKFYIVWFSAAFVLFVGSVQCTCKEETVEECDYNNLNGDCYNNMGVVSCLEALVGSCEGNLKVETLEQIKRHRADNQERLSACPAVPDGQCWHQPSWNCSDTLPEFIYMREEGNDIFKEKLDPKECKKLLKMEKTVRSCFDGFVQYCGNSALAESERYHIYSYLNDGVKACTKQLKQILT